MLAVSEATAPGSYTVTISGISGSLSASTAIALTVTGSDLPPATARVKYNFDMDWLFIRENVSGARLSD